MSNKNLLTTQAKVINTQLFYFAPNFVNRTVPDVPVSSLYCFLSKVDPWPDNEDPPVPTEDVKSLKQIAKNIFVTKQITSNDISPVVQRIDWTSGTVYDYYQDDVNMFERDGNGNLVRPFYVKNQYDQIFKCLWNNGGEPSTVEPYFEPGTYDTNNIFRGADKYKWKYILNLDFGSKVKFMDRKWIPLSAGVNSPSQLSLSSGSGGIDVINVIDGGDNYDSSNATISIVITGDGTGAAAYAEVSNGKISEIIVTNPGSNYSYATANVVSNLGSGAVLISPTSPIGGHGSNPTSELGSSHVMASCEFNGSEGGVIPTDIDFHQVGLIINPVSKESAPNPAEGVIYKTTTDLIVAFGFGTYINDEIVYQGNSADDFNFKGTILSFDEATNVIRLINTVGTPVLNAPVFGNDSKTVRTLLDSNLPNFLVFSGYMIYVENRSGIQRSFDGIEQFKIVLGY